MNPRRLKLLGMSVAVALALGSLFVVPYFSCGECGDPPKSQIYRCPACKSTGTCTLPEKIRFLMRQK